MKKLFLVIAVPVSLILFGCGNNSGKGDAITLKFNLPKGASYDYNIDMDMDMKGNANGQEVNMANKISMGYQFATKDDSAGWKKLSATITRLAMDINGGGVRIDYDSEKPSDTSNIVGNTIGKVLGAMKGGEFSFTMNEQGEVGQITGIQEMMQRAVSSIGGNSAAMMPAMSGAFSEENFRQNIQQSFAIYPKKPVRPGDSWTSSMNMNNGGLAMKTDNTYTLESVSGNTANIKMNSKISSPEGSTAMAVTGTMEGTMQYDVPTGVPVNGDLDMNMKMTMNAGTQSVPMNTGIKIRITGKKS